MASKLEGEAQCAQLEKRGLVHGCITRDFDYILFGGNNLYQVEFGAGGKIHDNILLLSMDYIQEKLCLSRSCLIAMSLMMGCDYYQKGIPGVGVVTALEIVSEFYIMQQDHPQVILDRFKAYASKAVPVRETDSLVKQKLRASSERLTVDLRDFNPNSDIVSNAVNVYMVPCVIEYSRTQLPKKAPPNHEKIQEILQRECQWDAKRAAAVIDKSFKKQTKLKSLASQRRLTSFFPVIRPRAVVTECTKEEGSNCSKREWAAMERLRINASQYSFNPVIEVISVPSLADEANSATETKPTDTSPGTSGNLKRKLSCNDGPQGPAPKQLRNDQSLTPSDTVPNKDSSPIVTMRNGEIVTIDEDSEETNDVIVIEEVAAPDKNRFQAIQSTA